MESPSLVGRNPHTASPGLLYLFIYLNLIPNTIILPILVGTFLFSTTATRHPILVNLCIAWILSGIYSCLLFYAGQHVGPEPNKGLCIAQTSLLYGITPMWSVAVLMLVYHMSITFDSRPSKAKFARLKLYLMLLAPYIAQMAFSLPCFVLSIEHPERVSRNRRFFYCALDTDALSNAMSIFTFTVCIGITALEAHLALILYRNWRVIRKAGHSSPVDVQIVVRVLAFGIYIFFGMIVSLISVFEKNSHVPDIFAATMGAVVLLVFGTQADIFRAWCFWKRTPQLVLPRPAATDGSRLNWYDTKTDAEVVTIDIKRTKELPELPLV